MMIAFKPLLKKTALVLLVFAALAGAASWALRAVGEYAAATLIPEIAGRYGLAGASVGSIRPGLFATVAGPIRLGDPAAPFLEAAFLKLEYTPAGLIRRRIERISVNGFVVNAAWRQGTLTLPGFTPAPADNASPPNVAAAFDWPLSIGAVDIDHGLIRLDLDGDRLQLPLALTLTAADDDMHRIDGRLRLFPRDQEIRISARLDSTRRGLAVQLTAPAFRPGSFADWTARIPGLRWSGQVALSARADLTAGPWQLVSAAADLRLTDGEIAYQDLSLGPLDRDRPLTIQVSGTEAQGWRLTGSAALVSPLPLVVTDLNCALDPVADNGPRIAWFSMTVDRMAASAPAVFDLKAPVTVAGDIQFEHAADGWRVAVTGQKPPIGKFHMKNDDVVVKTTVPAFTLSAEGAGEDIRFDVNVPLTRTVIAIDTAEVALSQALMRATADIARLPDGGRTIAGHVRLSAGKISATPGPLTIAKAALDLPFAWPASGGDQGKVAIGSVTWQGRDLGSLGGILQQQGRGVKFSGRYIAGLVPGLKGDLTGQAGLTPDGPDLAMDVHLRHQSEATDIDLGLFVPEAAGFHVNADLDLRAEIGLRHGDFTGRLNAVLAEGKIASTEKKMALTGIRADLTIPDLLTVRSAPAQKLFFKEASFGDIRAENGEIDFQLESATTLFIEKGGFQWCRGRVFAEGLRVSSDDDHYALTLYGDRLNLADVLNQIGGIRAEGDGTVSGRVPLRYVAGDITIDNGFLFSTPGEGGVIHLSKIDLLTAGLPKNSPQYSQIDLAREALKNYQYDWARLRLNSENDNLHVRLEFDGRPTRSLPFIYDKDTGGFVRSREDRNLSEFKGLSLDVNFRIPLNELIGYKKALTF